MQFSNQDKPTTTQREWGGVLGGPIVRNKAHFFVSLERQVDDPNRTGVFATRPDYNFAIAEDRTDWNTLIRFDHQINRSHTWAIRWLREWAPQWRTMAAPYARPQASAAEPSRAWTSKPPSAASTTMVSPSPTLPSRTSIAARSPSSRWMTRLRGRAPKAGS